MVMTRTILEEDLPSELRELRKRFPRLVENFEALQKVMAPFGVPSTLRVTTPDPAGTTTVRFIFLKQDNTPQSLERMNPGQLQRPLEVAKARLNKET